MQSFSFIAIPPNLEFTIIAQTHSNKMEVEHHYFIAIMPMEDIKNNLIAKLVPITHWLAKSIYLTRLVLLMISYLVKNNVLIY